MGKYPKSGDNKQTSVSRVRSADGSRCLGVCTEREISRLEARLGLVAMFMPTQPDGDYKLDLRGFEDRQIVTVLLGGLVFGQQLTR